MTRASGKLICLSVIAVVGASQTITKIMKPQKLSSFQSKYYIETNTTYPTVKICNTIIKLLIKYILLVDFNIFTIQP